MNTSFDIHRFCKLFANEWRINGKWIGLLWGGLSGLLIIFFLVAASWKNQIYNELIFMVTFLLVLVFHGLIVSIHFGDFTSKSRAQAQLLLPASKTETFFSKFIITHLIYPALAILFIYIVLHVANAYNHWIVRVLGEGTVFNNGNWIPSILQDGFFVLSCACIWLCAASALLWGSFTFKKLAMVKTFLFWFILFLLLIPVIGFLYFIMSGYYPEYYAPFFIIQERNPSVYYSLIDKYPYFLHWLGLFISISLIIISRVKYNEKTI